MSDIFFPASYARWTGGEWDERPLFGDQDAFPFTLGLYPQLQVGSTRVAYTYQFRVTAEWPWFVRVLFK